MISTLCLAQGESTPQKLLVQVDKDGFYLFARSDDKSKVNSSSSSAEILNESFMYTFHFCHVY